jgi:hypothetical protein
MPFFIVDRTKITWTRIYHVRLGPKDACGQMAARSVCCTYDIMDTYATTLNIELKLSADSELNRLTTVLLSSKQQIDGKSRHC